MVRTIACVLGAVLGIALLGSVLMYQSHTRASSTWKEFSIGPAYGQSVRINRGRIQADGITPKAALSVAYEIPTSRIIGPQWLGEKRYAIVAEVEDPDTFSKLFREEIKSRLRLTAHMENRPFDVFVLSATKDPQLGPETGGTKPQTWIGEWDAELTDGTMQRLTMALQSILGVPVVDETGIRGAYNLKFAWGSQRAESVKSVMERRFGLRLTAAKREMEALIVDSAQPEGALSLLEQVGRITAGTPRRMRERISQALAVH